nr:MAG TPA: hypothetical protein [Caudoviricetes sp.]DAV11771.1 MAG TPA: hypothetical protein [Caudoviricetes sp.]
MNINHIEFQITHIKEFLPQIFVNMIYLFYFC